MTELYRVRDQGFATIDQEVELGLRSIAVPLANARGQVIAALNIGRAIGQDRMEDSVSRLLPELQKVAMQLRGLLR
jgi:IclR family pca regulon transcriptional regulator